MDDDDDDESFASNISIGFERKKSDDDSIMSIQGEDPAPESVQEMLKNAVKILKASTKVARNNMGKLDRGRQKWEWSQDCGR